MNRSLVKNIGVTVIVVIIAVMLTGFRYDFFEIAKQIEIYNTLFKEINMSYVDKTDPAELMEDGVNHMLSELDPYTMVQKILPGGDRLCVSTNYKPGPL